MRRHALTTALAFLLVTGAPAWAAGEPPVPETVTFVVSTGFWVGAAFFIGVSSSRIDR